MYPNYRDIPHSTNIRGQSLTPKNVSVDGEIWHLVAAVVVTSCTLATSQVKVEGAELRV